MSVLVNPSFEAGSAPWDRLNIPNSVSYTVVHDPANARSGEHYLRFKTAVPGGSMAQDTQVAMPSVTALAHVRALGPGNVDGTFAIWDLDSNTNVSVNFTVGETWAPLTAMLSLPSGQRSVRIEIYLNTVDSEILVDNVNAF